MNNVFFCLQLPLMVCRMRVNSNYEWYPYEGHSGTIAGFSGKDYVIFAYDTRLADEHDVLLSRKNLCLHVLTNETVLLSTGFMGDVLTLSKLLKGKMLQYQYTHNKTMSTQATASLLSTMLYQKRFFPYYVYNIVAGLDTKGAGVIYGFDPVGSYEEVPYVCGGPGSVLIFPMLDSQIGQKNLSTSPKELTKEEAAEIITDMFSSAAERQVNVGDELIISLLDSTGLKSVSYPLRKD